MVANGNLRHQRSSYSMTTPIVSLRCLFLGSSYQFPSFSFWDYDQNSLFHCFSWIQICSTSGHVSFYTKLMTKCTVEDSAQWQDFSFLLIFGTTSDWGCSVTAVHICPVPYTIQISMSMNRAWLFSTLTASLRGPRMEAQVGDEQQWWKTWGSLLVIFGSITPDPSWTTSKLH